MRKLTWNIIIDTAGLAAFMCLTTTGVLMEFILPPGSGTAKTIWGLSRHGWGDIHFWIAVTFFSILAIHLILHWNWIVGILTGKKSNKSGKRFIMGLFSLLIILLLAVSPLLSDIKTGSSSGLPAETSVKAGSGLPADTPVKVGSGSSEHTDSMEHSEHVEHVNQ